MKEIYCHSFNIPTKCTELNEKKRKIWLPIHGDT